MIIDGANGGGYPRDINLGPKEGTIDSNDEDYTADCDGRVGESIVIIGYGCY
jgi:hypothetical protein